MKLFLAVIVLSLLSVSSPNDTLAVDRSSKPIRSSLTINPLTSEPLAGSMSCEEAYVEGFAQCLVQSPTSFCVALWTDFYVACRQGLE